MLVIGDGIALAALGMQRFNPIHRNGGPCGLMLDSCARFRLG